MTSSVPGFAINGRCIGDRQPAYLVAELSANHNQDFDHACALIRAAKDAGADAVKIQTYTPDTLTIRCTNSSFRIGPGTLWEGKTLYDLYEDAFTPWEWQPKLSAIARNLGIDFFSTPFDPSSVAFLEEMQVPAYKIASFELVDSGLLEAVARTGKPVILSTGMASLDEIREAVSVLDQGGCRQLALLKCTSAYPAPASEMNLRTIPHMASTFGVPVGLSDHTTSTTIPVAAVTLGASIVEKHFTLDRSAGGPDSAFSMEPEEFSAMVDAIRECEQALGSVNYDITEVEAASRIFRRSLFVVQEIREGEQFSAENLRSIRPGNGLPPKYLRTILGRRAACDISRGTPLRWEHVIGGRG